MPNVENRGIAGEPPPLTDAARWVYWKCLDLHAEQSGDICKVLERVYNLKWEITERQAASLQKTRHWFLSPTFGSYVMSLTALILVAIHTSTERIERPQSPTKAPQEQTTSNSGIPVSQFDVGVPQSAADALRAAVESDSLTARRSPHQCDDNAFCYPAFRIEQCPEVLTGIVPATYYLLFRPQTYFQSKPILATELRSKFCE